MESKIANERFDRARVKELLGRVFSIFNPDTQNLLAFKDIRKILKSSGESYRGIKPIPINKIVGSEGRYKDFSSKFLPRYEALRTRWTSIDKAHQKDIILPAIVVYEVGGAYFIRDGNHRVSVAKNMGMEEIDAEIISINTPLTIKEPINFSTLKKKIIEYERSQFLAQIHKKYHQETEDLVFSETGRYDEITKHIQDHKNYLAGKGKNLNFSEAFIAWKTHIFHPIIHLLEEENILGRFRGRTPADMYVWIVKHGSRMERFLDHKGLNIREVIQDLSKKFGKNQFQRLTSMLKKIINPSK